MTERRTSAGGSTGWTKARGRFAASRESSTLTSPPAAVVKSSPMPPRKWRSSFSSSSFSK
ncbi:MAG: hypothetical protein QM704_14335 [Anaeromyxobacteraceae bacterium]